MQDDYNRFIRRSVMQAQCDYEDIFAADAEEASCGCMGTMGDSDMKASCGCMGTMGDSDRKASCGCEKNLPVMAFVEMQTFGRTYNEAEGLCRGTLFPALDKPFTGRGGCR